MKKTTRLLAGAVAVAIGGLAMTNIASAYEVTYHPEANVSFTLNGNENFTAGLITITDGTETYTIMDRNLGATKSGSTCSSSDFGACGYYFQWGNNYGFPTEGSVATSSTQVDASGYGPGNYYSSNTFITRSSSPYDWSIVQNDNLRGGVSGTYEAMQGPCPEGYHVPSSGEWLGLSTMLGYDGKYNSTASKAARDRLNTELYLPFAGYRYYSSAGVNNQGTIAYYWSSTAYSADLAYYLYFSSAGLYPQNGNYRSFGFSVRCFKDSPYSASDLPSEGGDGSGGDSKIIVSIAALNSGQNTCSGEDFIFPAITAKPTQQVITLAKKFQCIFGNSASKAVTLALSGDLTDGNGNVISGENVKLSNPEWTEQPTGLKVGNTMFSKQTFLGQGKTLFNKTGNKIGTANGSGVEIEITVPGGTPDGTYNGTLVLTY